MKEQFSIGFTFGIWYSQKAKQTKEKQFRSALVSRTYTNKDDNFLVIFDNLLLNQEVFL